MEQVSEQLAKVTVVWLFLKSERSAVVEEKPDYSYLRPVSFVKGPPVNLPLTSTTADLSDLRKSQTTVTFASCSETCSIVKVSPTTTSSTGTCSSLVAAVVPRLRQTPDTPGNSRGSPQ